ncbi:formylglycine-generating enzyme family protein [Sphingomonas nostoxanthinifaciens]|uniref:formylglycine-generating enzyme family protein n=1 Tax=Sphingomonas nostoxanthinifaciens TaxID=2872652 RepID=UPI001CC1DB03|nr:formylglycine-generating enzyme family protein [Sphingomonas nostoxanthinifaciens]UAK25383.1 formylglycine-generating enzyme family protein [Sphingomonas nostoxanthinifaciens]
MLESEMMGQARSNVIRALRILLISGGLLPTIVVGQPPRPRLAANAAARPVFDDCSAADWCPKMVPIPAGTFMMGSTTVEPGRFEDEGPRRHVSVARFAVGEFPITKRQWAAYATATKLAVPKGACDYAPSPNPSWKDVGYAQTDNDPVVCITWGEARAYARWLSSRTGHPYRLLSEAEWEYAARAGSTTAFPWGAVADHNHANYGLDECCGPRTLGRDRWENTSPVGAFPPNAFGLYDMHGDVFEWVEDCHADSYASAPTDGSAFEQKGCTSRVARGGVYADTWKVMRSAARNYAPPDSKQSIETYRSAGFGFRVARALP